MAVLSLQERLRVVAGFMREGEGPFAFTKPQLAAAVAAADDWVEANSTSYNQALPVGFRTSATTAQKIAVLCYALMRRAGRLRVSEDG